MPITVKSKKQKKLEEHRKQLMKRQRKPQRKETPLPKLTPAQKKQVVEDKKAHARWLKELEGMRTPLNKLRGELEAPKPVVRAAVKGMLLGAGAQFKNHKNQFLKDFAPVKRRNKKEQEEWERKKKLEKAGGWVKGKRKKLLMKSRKA